MWTMGLLFTFEKVLPNFARESTVYAEKLQYSYAILFCMIMFWFFSYYMCLCNLLILFFKVSTYEHPSFRELIWDLIFSKNISNELEKAR